MENSMNKSMYGKKVRCPNTEDKHGTAEAYYFTNGDISSLVRVYNMMCASCLSFDWLLNESL